MADDNIIVMELDQGLNPLVEQYERVEMGNCRIQLLAETHTKAQRIKSNEYLKENRIIRSPFPLCASSTCSPSSTVSQWKHGCRFSGPRSPSTRVCDTKYAERITQFSIFRVKLHSEYHRVSNTNYVVRCGTLYVVRGTCLMRVLCHRAPDLPEVTKYAGLVCAQAHRQELIQDLYKSPFPLCASSTCSPSSTTIFPVSPWKHGIVNTASICSKRPSVKSKVQMLLPHDEFLVVTWLSLLRTGQKSPSMLGWFVHRPIDKSSFKICIKPGRKHVIVNTASICSKRPSVKSKVQMLLPQDEFLVVTP